MNQKNVIANRYEVIQHIGKGGMADVFLAVDMILNRQVAIKILHSDLSKDALSIVRFEREAQAAASLAHSNIVEIYDVGEYRGHHYIVMEYLKGQNLKEIIRQRAPLFLEEAVDILKQLAFALACAHAKGIIHRDIKPQNVIVKSDGTIKVLDFGIAIAKGNLQLTRANNVMGSVHYLAPELAKGDPATPQSDIYALGVVFYEMLTGDVPYKAEQAIQIAMKHLREPVPSLRSRNNKIPLAIDNICLKAMAKDRKDRYANCEELLADLGTCLYTKDSDVEPYVPESFPKKEKEKKKNSFFTKAVCIGLVVLSLLVLTGFIYHRYFVKTTMPNIVGLELNQARQRLKEAGLSVDETKIKRALSGDYEADQVSGADIESGHEVRKGTKVTLVVSSGKGVLIENYLGQDVEDVQKKLSVYPKLKIRMNAKKRKGTPGTIIAQSGLSADSLFDPTKETEISLDYIAYLTKVIPRDIIGKTVDEAAKELEAMGFNVRRSNRDTSQMTQEELDKIQVGIVVDTNPKVGTKFVQKKNNYVTLFFY
ncbi:MULTISPECIES: protein kinase [Terrabacteria group]|uniref:protein kinase domain-containing protein n=1 Tax=Bacillati TaxID=1783272 RepID=UPI001C6DEA8C|nr:MULTISPECIES: protein kinase [Terrabacteria group]MBW9212368.1 protein kinase [Trueperella sp. zg.1013]